MLGCDILPARVLCPTDKQVVERVFGSIRSLLLELRLGYTGVDVADCGLIHKSTRSGRSTRWHTCWPPGRSVSGRTASSRAARPARTATHANLPFQETPMSAAVTRLLGARISANALKRQPTTRAGVMINGGGYRGKTETACEVAAS